MHNIIMIAAMKYSKSDGISKKICMQAAGLSYKNKCTLICIGENATVQILYTNGICIKETIHNYNKVVKAGPGDFKLENQMLKHSLTVLKSENPDILYVRHMLPSHLLVRLLVNAKKMGTKIAYEIPTYPYYKEQYNISNNKIKTVVKLFIETVFWPIIYNKVDLMTVMKCNSKAHMWKKMLSIPNGFSGQTNYTDHSNCEDLNLIGVGTIYPYHGYEKVINDMERAKCRVKNGKIFFHIVGESAEIARLEKLVKDKKMEKNVIFYGKKYAENLLNVYKKCNLGVGTLALSLRAADIDTAIKNIEYFSMGLPVITSGYVFDIPIESNFYVIQDEKKQLNFEQLLAFSNSFYQIPNIEGRIKELLEKFDWNNIMQSIIHKLR